MSELSLIFQNQYVSSLGDPIYRLKREPKKVETITSKYFSAKLSDIGKLP